MFPSEIAIDTVGDEEFSHVQRVEDGVRIVEGLLDEIHRSINVLEHMVVVEVQDEEPATDQPRIARKVLSDVIVDPSVDLDDESSRQTDEVDDEWTDRLLPSEPYADLASSQLLPEFVFGACGFAAHLTCETLESSVSPCHKGGVSHTAPRVNPLASLFPPSALWTGEVAERSEVGDIPPV